MSFVLWRLRIMCGLLIPRNWTLAMGIFGTTVTAFSLATNRDQATGAGVALTIAGSIGIGRDSLAAFRSYRSIYSIPADVNLEDVELSESEKDYIRISRENRSAIYSPSVNEYLQGHPEIPLEIRSRKFTVDTRFRETHDLIVAFELSKGRIHANEMKIRLEHAPTCAENQRFCVRPTRYFNSLSTNECATRTIRSRTGRPPANISAELVFPHGRLPPLAQSACSNHIGVDTLAFTSRGELVYSFQTERNAQQGGLIAPSGSGSADWGDVESTQQFGGKFYELLQTAMCRELAEECGVSVRMESRQQTKVLGYWRDLARGGKPQFSGITPIDAARDAFKVTRRERRYGLDHRFVKIDLTSRETVVSSIEVELATSRQAQSFPLFMNLTFLRQWSASSPEAFELLRTWATNY